MIFRMWHLDLIPDSNRGTFELPEWPYAISKYGPVPPILLAYLQQWGTIRIELEGKPNKLMVPLRADHPKIERGEEVENWRGIFNCYLTSGQIDKDSFHILSWNVNDPSFKKYVGKVPDNAAWLEWNRAVDVKQMNPSLVSYA